MLTYQEAKAKLGTRESKKIANNTYLHALANGDIAIRLHSTDIVTLAQNHGRYVLNSGGWKTVTTKARMNEFAPSFIGSVKGIWYQGRHDMAQIPYFDGMIVNAHGECVNPPSKSATDTLLANKRKLDKATRAYIKGFCAHYVSEAKLNGVIPTPSGGDCWFCCMRPAEEGEKGNGWNCVRIFDVKAETQFGGVEHILSHIGIAIPGEEVETYYVPSLLANAIRTSGVRDPRVIWSMINSDALRGETSILARELRTYFRRLKPALLDAMSRETAKV